MILLSLRASSVDSGVNGTQKINRHKKRCTLGVPAQEILLCNLVGVSDRQREERDATVEEERSRRRRGGWGRGTETVQNKSEIKRPGGHGFYRGSKKKASTPFWCETAYKQLINVNAVGRDVNTHVHKTTQTKKTQGYAQQGSRRRGHLPLQSFSCPNRAHGAGHAGIGSCTIGHGVTGKEIPHSPTIFTLPIKEIGTFRNKDYQI